ncbi:cyclic peptide export ABC transporter [Paenibacillus athensensis]|uniref:Peptide ABC transporter n=1 Tax=Paenibacillus athensensis TaxID=1967502 RepID=A0A4Y8PWG3_9BACL|nr:cyclic peptide export ABC transporter [Paenibacillus athensensis]MCD1260587.1 cyclic peptide export ABC transporter [Paenibacillus athensensis]
MIRHRIVKLLFAVVLLAALGLPAVVSAAGLTPVEQDDIEAYIHKYLKKSDIPGLSVVMIKDGQTVYKQGFGYADKASGRSVTPDTLFELGSTSKAFTALGVLQLEQAGKLSLSDPVSKYLPWFTVTYKGQPTAITLEQLLHHTSGIPFKSIGEIPIAEGDGALEQTVRTLVGQKLDFLPGDKYLYATINYDVLGLIIQTVTGQPYEAYMQANVLKPLHMDHTVLFRQQTAGRDMAVGYKFNFLHAAAYDAPMYRGNTPAGYYITNGQDIEKWLKAQLGLDTGDLDRTLIEKSHLPDTTVAPSPDGGSYAAGWGVFQSGSGEISHGGNNPNFSSFLAFRQADGMAVGVLANLNSSYTQTIGQGILNIMKGKKLPDPVSDMYKGMDNVSSAILIITAPVILLIVWFLLISIRQAARGQRKYAGSPGKLAGGLMLLVLFAAGLAYCLYSIPDVLYYELNWDFVSVWAPATLRLGVGSLFIASMLFSLYFLFTWLYPQKGDKSLFAVTLLSIASGLGNAMIIFIVNETLARNPDDGFQGGLLLYFMVGIGIYVFGQKLVRTRLIHIANDMVYNKRTELIDKILNTSYQNLEELEYGKIQASLNNDTETISDFSNIVITGATSLVTLICCFVYMGIISFPGLLVSLFVIVLAAGLHFIIGRQANRLWEQTRDIQNIFFRFINDLIGGFKELSMHRGKRGDFQRDMVASSGQYREKRIQGDLKFANVNVIGELLFTFVIGAVAFLFPVLFADLKTNDLRSYVFILLYMTGPVHGILGTIPNVFRVKISWGRLTEMSRYLDAIQAEQAVSLAALESGKPLELTLKDIVYQYKNKEGESFSVGPISHTFRSGEITFITGGNGSGKSTLARLATGLYTPDSGEVLLNGEPVPPGQIGQAYSAIFADFHLFEKLYGLEYADKQQEMDAYMKLLHLTDKVQIRDGQLSTIKLSTGQRKRLALMISYLEDRPVYLFDEWAADQDPEFRMFFYNTLLPELKQRGKCVIAITHDDRYFGLADQVIKMELGRIVSSERQLVPAP